MKKIMMALCSVLAWVSMGNSAWSAEATKISTYPIFDSQKADNKVSHYTHSWIKGSNMTPQGQIVKSGQNAYLQITYTGKQGMARTSFSCPDTLPAGVEPYGIQITLDSNLPVGGDLSVEAVFRDNTSTVFLIKVQKGMTTYKLTQVHFRAAKTPMDWKKISCICLDSKNPAQVLNIQKVELLTR